MVEEEKTKSSLTLAKEGAQEVWVAHLHLLGEGSPSFPLSLSPSLPLSLSPSLPLSLSLSPTPQRPSWRGEI
jgi:hypothetical protein